MPRYARRRRPRRRMGRRPMRRTRRRGGRRRYKRLPINGWPKKLCVKLRYADTFGIDVAAASASYANFCANGCYDPDLALGGHQPRGFDQIMPQYNHYTVIGSKISITYLNDTGSNIVPAIYDVLLKDDVTFNYTTQNDIVENAQSRGKWQNVGTERNYIGYKPQIVRKFNAKKFFGVSGIVGNNNYSGTVASNPDELAVFQLVVANIFGNDPGRLIFGVVIDYVVVFTEPKFIPAS